MKLKNKIKLDQEFEMEMKNGISICEEKREFYLKILHNG